MRFLIAGALALLVFVPDAYPCDCISRQTPLEELKRSDAVFTGTVRDIISGEITEYRFSVALKFKGVSGDTKSVSVFVDTRYNCAVFLDKGSEYIVYASKSDRHEGRLVTNICTRTTDIANAKEDLSALGREPPQ